MSRVQSDGPGVEGTAVQPSFMESVPDTPVRPVQDEPGDTGQSGCWPEHSLLSRRATPQGRRSLFRR